MHIDQIFVSIASGGQVSGIAPLRSNTRGVGIWVPTIDSCTLQPQASWDQTSANFFPVQAPPPASGAVLLPTDVGSKYVTLGVIAEQLPQYLRLRTGVALTNPATFCIAVRF